MAWYWRKATDVTTNVDARDNREDDDDTLRWGPLLLDAGRGVSRFVQFPLRKLSPEAIALGYAATTHKMQGQTVAHAHSLMSGNSLSHEMASVQATRAKETTRIFIDPLHAGHALRDLIKNVDRTRAKKLAHDLLFRPQPNPQPRTNSPSLRRERST